MNEYCEKHKVHEDDENESINVKKTYDLKKTINMCEYDDYNENDEDDDVINLKIT